MKVQVRTRRRPLPLCSRLFQRGVSSLLYLRAIAAEKQNRRWCCPDSVGFSLELLFRHHLCSLPHLHRMFTLISGISVRRDSLFCLVFYNAMCRYLMAVSMKVPKAYSCEGAAGGGSTGKSLVSVSARAVIFFPKWTVSIILRSRMFSIVMAASGYDAVMTTMKRHDVCPLRVCTKACRRQVAKRTCHVWSGWWCQSLDVQ